ncbi:MAG TPA: FAD-dependent oxidoreductase, partial [Aliiroseovarius sp.]|nr:FAD-dependent oxidoreductase [Aliiroseovarius sp.]
MARLTLQISGMTCEHCARGIEDALGTIDGVRASVSYEEGTARVESDGAIDTEQVIRTIESLGYGVRSMDDEPERTVERGGRLSVAIVGGGSAAFAGAIEAAGRGARVTLIEGAQVIGGTCVNIGCVPSKIMIRAAHLAHLQAHHPFEGLSRCTPDVDRPVLVRRQQARVDELRHAKYEHILETRPEIRLVRGWARFA